jgi:hypothetical protein
MRGEQAGGEQVIGSAAGGSRKEVGRGGGDDDQRIVAGECDVVERLRRSGRRGPDAR